MEEQTQEEISTEQTEIQTETATTRLELKLKENLNKEVEEYFKFLFEIYIQPNIKPSYTCDIFSLKPNQIPNNSSYWTSRKMILTLISLYNSFEIGNLRTFKYGNFKVDLKKKEVINLSTFKSADNVFNISLENQYIIRNKVFSYNRAHNLFNLKFSNLFLNKLASLENPGVILGLMYPIFRLQRGYLGRETFMVPQGGNYEAKFRMMKGIIYIHSTSIVVHFIAYANCDFYNENNNCINGQFSYCFHFLDFGKSTNDLNSEIKILASADYNKDFGVNAILHKNYV